MLTDNPAAPIVNVTFAPGTLNSWHVHKGGQVLLVTHGRGWYCEWEGAARELKPGDVVDIPAGVKHWHGAAKDSWFAHISIEIDPEKGPAEWLEPVAKEGEAAVSSRSSSIGKNGETLACASPFFRALSKGCFLSRSFRASPVERVSQASVHSPPPTPQEARAKGRHPSRRRLPHGGRSRS